MTQRPEWSRNKFAAAIPIWKRRCALIWCRTWPSRAREYSSPLCDAGCCAQNPLVRARQQYNLQHTTRPSPPRERHRHARSRRRRSVVLAALTSSGTAIVRGRRSGGGAREPHRHRRGPAVRTRPRRTARRPRRIAVFRGPLRRGGRVVRAAIGSASPAAGTDRDYVLDWWPWRSITRRRGGRCRAPAPLRRMLERVEPAAAGGNLGGRDVLGGGRSGRHG